MCFIKYKTKIWMNIQTCLHGSGWKKFPTHKIQDFDQHLWKANRNLGFWERDPESIPRIEESLDDPGSRPWICFFGNSVSQWIQVELLCSFICRDASRNFHPTLQCSKAQFQLVYCETYSNCSTANWYYSDTYPTISNLPKPLSRKASWKWKRRRKTARNHGRGGGGCSHQILVFCN